MMEGICAQCQEYVTESNECLCTHAIHTVPEVDCPWCGLPEHEQTDVLEELGLGFGWEVLWLGHNYGPHRPGCGPVYGLRGTERTFAYCVTCQTQMALEPTS